MSVLHSGTETFLVKRMDFSEVTNKEVCVYVCVRVCG